MTRAYELSEMNGDAYRVGGEKNGGGGCFVSTVTGFVLVLVCILISVGVGLIVHLASPGEVVCHCHSDGHHGDDGVTEGQDGAQQTTSPAGSTPTTTESIENSTIFQQCIEWASQGNPLICNACANVNLTTPELIQTTTSSPPTEPINYRLPSNTKPYHYNVDIQPNMYEGPADEFTFNGSVKIWIECLEESDIITLHAHQLDVIRSSIVINEVDSDVNLFTGQHHDPVRQFLVLHLSMNMIEGNKYTIYMEFSGPLQGSGSGLYLSSYTDNDQTVYLATTQFEAPYARRAFPCYDEPALKATFNTTLRHKLNTGRNYTTLSNMDIYNSYDDGDYGVDEYSTTVIMPTYLLAFIICDYEYFENISLNTQIPYRTYARPNAIEYAKLAQDHGITIFDKYESYFTPSYSLPKIDNIAIPDFSAGAMENWGLITYREALLYYPSESTASTEKWIAEVISHEVAHQWFGNLVSPKWWKWLWLNEAFASFWDYHIVGEVYPTWRSLDLHIADGKHAIFVDDALRTSHPLTYDVESNTEISSIFDGITYTKGSEIVRMMHFIMGQDLFITGLNNYLNTFQYSVAEHYDLFNKLTETAFSQNEQLNMTELMDPWVTQANYPVVMVTKTASGFQLTQKRFLIGTTDEEAENDTAPYGYKWPIPITYTTSRLPNFEPDRNNVTMLNGDGSPVIIEETLEDNDWIIINLQQHGFYRVNYDDSNWEALINQLNADHLVIHPINRAQIINDAANIAKAGMLDPLTSLKTLDYLERETDYLPWRAFSREMGYVESMLRRSDIYIEFSKKMQSMVQFPMETIGLNITENMEHIDIFAITTVSSFACNHGVTYCISEAVDKFREWMNTGEDGINPNLRSLFYCTAVSNGGFEEWEFVYNQYKISESVSKKDALRRALSCTKEIALLQRVLDMSLDENEVRSQDTRTTIQYVAENPLGVDLTWNFFRYKFEELKISLASLNSFSRLLASITQSFNTQFYLEQIQSMMDNYDIGDYESAFQKAIETTQANIGWLEKNYNVYKDWLLPSVNPVSS